MRLYSTIWGRDAEPAGDRRAAARVHQGRQLRGRRLRRRAASSAPASASSPLPPRTRCTATSPASSPAPAGRSVGFALKLHQRAWALLRGRLRDRVDLRPAGQPQRLLQPGQARRASRSSTSRTSTAPCSTASTATTTPTGCWSAGGSATRGRGGVRGRPHRRVADELAAGAVVALGVSADGEPVPGRLDGTTSLVAVPRDIEALRPTDPAPRSAWRVAVREALVGADRRRRPDHRLRPRGLVRRRDRRRDGR